MLTKLALGVVATVALQAVAMPASSAAALPGDSLPFSSAVFRATHNSYSGNIGGTRGAIGYQLDQGIRYVELDVWSGAYATVHDYQIGHSGVGDQVDHTGGNPAGNNLRDWLSVVATWSAAHPTHAPIVVMLDLKDDLTTRPSYAAGNLTAVNQELVDVFGSQLVLASSGALPTIGALRGKVLGLLSGNAASRTEYKRDTGMAPSVAVNAHGQVIEVHDSGAGALWYWTGTLGADGRVSWLRHGHFDSGKTPAVALNDAGQVVEVHDSGSGALWASVGQLAADGDVTWQAAKKYDTGVLPTIAYTSSGAVREIHKSPSSAQDWDWLGTVTPTAVTWGAHAKTSDARFPTTTSGGVSVAGGSPLTYSTPVVTAQRIQYRQVAFDEYQAGDSAELQDGAIFWASTASNTSFIASARSAGHVVRGWDFDSASYATTPLATYPATNTPYAAWYQSMVNTPNTVS